MNIAYSQSGPSPLDMFDEARLPEPGQLLHCLVCATEKPWGVYDSKTKAAVCIECRDKARQTSPAPETSAATNDLPTSETIEAYLVAARQFLLADQVRTLTFRYRQENADLRNENLRLAGLLDQFPAGDIELADKVAGLEQQLATEKPTKLLGPFAVMSGAPWNVLDASGSRIALCGGDSNQDWERFGPGIAAAIVDALNSQQQLAAKDAEIERLNDLLHEHALIVGCLRKVKPAAAKASEGNRQ